jgi:Rod binding domain-containing protein
MDVASLQRSVNASELPLEWLATNSQLSDAEKVTEVSRHFEAILLKQILQEAQKSSGGSSLFPHNFSNDIYTDMLSEQMAESISKSGKFGLADSFKSQLTQQLSGRKTAGTDTVHAETAAAPSTTKHP